MGKPSASDDGKPAGARKPALPRGANRRSIIGVFKPGQKPGPGRPLKNPVMVYFDRRALEHTSSPLFWREFLWAQRKVKEAAIKSRSAGDFLMYFKTLEYEVTRAYGQPKVQQTPGDTAEQERLMRVLAEVLDILRNLPEEGAARFLSLVSGDGDGTPIDVTPGK